MQKKSPEMVSKSGMVRWEERRKQGEEGEVELHVLSQATPNHRRVRLGFQQHNDNAYNCALMVIFGIVSLAFNG